MQSGREERPGAAFGWARHASPLHGASDDIGDAIPAQEWPERRDVADKHVVAPADSRTAREIVDNGVSDFLRQRQPDLIASLA